MNPRLFLKPNLERRLVMTLALRQAVEILQMPLQELSLWLQREIEKNPLLEFNFPLSGKRFEREIIAPTTLYEHIQRQIVESFLDPKERILAEILAENLDERGFLCPLPKNLEKQNERLLVDQPEIDKVLSTLQTFDPPGIFARNLQECLLIQLKMKGKQTHLSFRLVETCFEDLLHGRYTAIKKRLGITDLSTAIQQLARLSLRPATAFSHQPLVPIYPDLSIYKVDGGWTLELVEDELPKFHIKNEYLSLEPEIQEEKETFRNFKTQAKWIFRSLNRRRNLLRQIGRLLLCKQAAYLEQKGPLNLFTMKELSEKVGIHESTLSRALSGKYASTPRGIIPLRALVSSTPATKTAQEILEQLIRTEDKESPMTDDELAQQLKAQGFPVARRTIAKYRTQLKIGPASQRKHLVKNR